MTTVAVAGLRRPAAAALLADLDASPSVRRLVGIGGDAPDMPPGSLDLVDADPRDPLPESALSGVDVLVTLLEPPGPERGDEAAARDLSAIANLLAAASTAGVRRLVHLSSGAVYGARPDNPVPLTEQAPLRAPADFPWAYHHLLAEELVDAWAREHPEAEVVVLRPATVPFGGGAVARHLLGPVLPVVRGTSPPVQLVAADDLASALLLAVTGPLRGAYNVAADGWLTTEELASLLGRVRLPLGEVVAAAVARMLWRTGVTDAPPGALPYLMYPWLLSSARLKAAGWAPAKSNRDVVRALAESGAGAVYLGRARIRLRSALAWATTSAAVPAGLVLWALVRSRRVPGGQR